MRAMSHIHSIHPVAGAAWRPATSVADFAAHIARTLRHRIRHSAACRTAACLLAGHEKWTAMSGDWACMRCGKVKRLEVPNFPASPETTALPRFNS